MNSGGVTFQLGPLMGWRHPGFPLPHAFFQRQGGFSDPPFATFNTAYRTEDPQAPANRALLLEHLSLTGQPGRILNPCHGDRIALLTKKDFQAQSQGILLQTDAAFTRLEGHWLLVSTADCIPLVVTDGELMGVVHLGWRNVVDHLAAKAITAAARHFDLAMDRIWALLGPAIHPCCYRFRDPGQQNDPFWQPFLHTGPDGLTAIDLMAATKAQLLACGVPGHQILDMAICTGCCNQDFFSCYQEGYRSGRFPTVVWRPKP